jgi:NAD-dependent histone deacetylase SIR2
MDDYYLSAAAEESTPILLQGETFDDKLDSIASLLSSRKNIIALVGAGISVSAGIPDFRSATGLYNTLDHQVSEWSIVGTTYVLSSSLLRFISSSSSSST